jgi:hypothetical protein
LCRRSIACWIVSPPSTGAKSIVVVVPPCKAARLTRGAGSVNVGWATPGIGIGQLQWTCGSMPPGMTICPAASTTRPAPSAARRPGAPVASMRSPLTPISAGLGARRRA